ncbi:replication factor-a protein [Ascobolus immersus RN42]|uniref:Replication protein A subunit n=1 Tax=Ascobolus immersus RN42 TaxID=1160509 RepID=A0A3N4I4N7_ASCIM|nr:replication factor-a protein [Ascobolus immersus RN42]
MPASAAEAEAAITRGCLRKIFPLVGMPNTNVQGPVMQILQIKHIPGQNGSPDRFRLVLNDTENFILSMMATQANDLVREGKVTKGCLVRLTKYTASEMKQKRILVVVDVDILTQYGEHEKLGMPASLETGQPLGAQPPINQGTRPTSFYGSNPPKPAIKHESPAPRSFGASKPQQGHSTHGPVYPIESLSPYQNKWTIKARVSYKSDIKTWTNQKGSGKLFTVHFLDESGEIRATGFNDQCDALYEVLQEGQVYYVSQCKVNMAKKQFSTLKNEYELMFERDTQVERCTDDDGGVPAIKFNPVALGSLESVEPNSLIDVIGILIEIGDLGEIVSKTTSKTFKKRDITIADNSGYSVRVTLWGAQAENFDVPMETVIGCKGVKVGDFGGRSLSMLMSSQLTVSPDVVEAHKLKGWYDAQGRSENFSRYHSSGGGGGGAGASDAWKNIAMTKDEQLGFGEKPDYFWMKATVAFIKQESVYYPACPSSDTSCNRKVLEDGGVWRCERCNQTFEKPTYRYVLQCSLEDFTGGGVWVSCFDDAGRLILGMTADELNDIRERDQTEYAAVFEKALSQTFNFSVRAKLDTYQDQQRTRLQVMKANPLNFAEECHKLMKIIHAYD